MYVVSYKCNYCRRSLSLRDRRGLNNVKKREKKAIASEKKTLCKHLKHRNADAGHIVWRHTLLRLLRRKEEMRKKGCIYIHIAKLHEMNVMDIARREHGLRSITLN